MFYYTFFFDNAEPTLIVKAQQLVRESMKRKKVDRLKCFDGTYKYVERYDGKRISLGSLVELLVEAVRKGLGRGLKRQNLKREIWYNRSNSMKKKWKGRKI